jgi:hypothetical protein
MKKKKKQTNQIKLFVRIIMKKINHYFFFVQNLVQFQRIIFHIFAKQSQITICYWGRYS